MIVSALLSLAIAATSPAPSPGAREVKGFPGVEDASFVAADATRFQRLSVVVPAPPAAVWTAFSSAEGWKSWAVKSAYVDFREGGVIETNYQPDKPQGGRDNIKNQIVAIEPGRLLAFRNTQAPTGFKNPDLFARVITVLRLEPLEGGRTRVICSGDGYGAGEGFDGLYRMFLAGNAYTLAELRDHFAKH